MSPDSYPIAVPPGRNGFQPSIDLSYSSRSVDGMLASNTDQGPFGQGWSLSEISISRNGIHIGTDGTNTVVWHPDFYRLSINGSSYDLYSNESVANAVTRYYAQGAPGIQVWRYLDNAWTGTGTIGGGEDLSWIVKLANGTVYRLGKNSDSEVQQAETNALVINHNQDQDSGDQSWNPPGGGGGANAMARRRDWSGMHWYVDTATDPYGNQIQYSYTKWTEDQSLDGQTISTNHIRLAEVRYNYAQRATAFDPVSGNYASRIIFDMDGNHRVTRIRLYHLDVSLTLPPYRAIYFGLDSLTDTSCGVATTTNRLTSIQEKNGTLGSEASALPATTFSYSLYPHAKINNNTCDAFKYHYVTGVDNGYGGSVTFSYQSDNRYDTSSGNLPNYGTSYFVTSKSVKSTATGPAAITEYSYSTPCYDNTEQAANQFECRSRQYIYVSGIHKQWGALGGFNRVIVTSKDYNGVVIAKSIHWYHQDRLRFGRSYYDQKLDGNLAATTVANYGGETGDLTGWFAHDPSGVQTEGVDTNLTNAWTGQRSVIISVNSYSGADHWLGTTISGVQPGTYWLSFVARSITSSALLEITWSSDNGVNGTPLSVLSGVPLTTQYQQYLLPIAVPAGATAITLQFRTPTAFATYWLDDVDLNPVALMQRTTYVTRAPAGSPTNFVVIDGHQDYRLDGNRSAVAGSNTVYSYDDYGNVLTEVEYFANNQTHLLGGVYKIYPVWSFTAQRKFTYRYDGQNASTTEWVVNRLKGVDTYKCNDATCATSTLQASRRTVWGPGQGVVSMGNWGVTTQRTDKPRYERTWIGGTSWIDQQLTYDDFGNRTLSYTYESYGSDSILQTVGGRITGYTYDSTWNLFVTAVTPPYVNASLAISIYYYGVNDPLSASAPGGISRIRDANGQDTEYKYDAFGRLGSIRRPYDTTGYETIRYYYTDGSNFTLTTARQETAGTGANQPTVEIYDGLGRLLQVRAEMTGGATQSVVDYVYDGLGRQVAQYVPVSQAWSWGLSRPAGWDTRPKSTTQYDWLGRAVRETGPDGVYTDHAYAIDHSGFQNVCPSEPTGLMVNRHVSRGAQLRDEIVDPSGQVVQVREYSGWTWPSPNCGTNTGAFTQYAVTKFEYDVTGNLTQVTDNANNVTDIAYDNGGRRIAITDPDMGHWEYQYAAGRNLLWQQKDQKNNYVCLFYDALDRVTRKTTRTTPCPTSNPGVGGVVYGYDSGPMGLGHRTSMNVTDGSSSSTWAYDARGRVITQAVTIAPYLDSFTTAYQYDSMDRVTQTTYPGTQEKVITSFNEQGMVSSVQSGTDANSFAGYYYASGLAYDEAGRLTGISYGGLASDGSRKVQSTYTYYPWTTALNGGLLQTIASTQTTPSTLRQSLTFTYDAMGNVKSITDATNASQRIDFAYDELNRMLSAVTTGVGADQYSAAYSYTPLGNIQTASGVPVAGTYGYGDAGHKHAVTSIGSTNSFAYDANGNMITRTLGSTTTVLNYDAENRVISTTTGSNGTIFTYDGDGNRIKETLNDGTYTLFVGELLEVECSRPPDPTVLTPNPGIMPGIQAVSWTPTDGARSYQVWIDDLSTIPVEPATIVAPPTVQVDFDFLPGHQYSVWIQSKTACGLWSPGTSWLLVTVLNPGATQTVVAQMTQTKSAALTLTAAPSPTRTYTPNPATATPTPTKTVTATATRTSTPTATSAGGGTQLTRQIAASSDDANEDGATFDSTSTTVWLGTGGSTSSSYAGFRFTNVTIPQGATITSAKLQVYVPSTTWTQMGFTYAAENVANSATFSSSSKPSQRTLTTQTVSHSSNAQWVASTWYDLDEINSVVQPVISRADWASGNALAIILKGTGSSYGRKSVTSFDGTPANAVRLVITYTTGGPTPTNTPTRTVTATATRTNTPTGPTSTPTRTPTVTATTVGGTCSVLDTFNRANGAIGTNWGGNSGTAYYQIASNQLDVVYSGDTGPILWNPTSFGATQQACVKLAAIDGNANDIALVLKAQSNTGIGNGLMEVLYDPTPGSIRIWTYDTTNDWVQRGSDLSATFAAGDTLRVIARSNGQVEIYKNSTLLGTRDVSAWTYSGQGGYIGLWSYNGPNTIFDDFGGGTYSGQSSWNERGDSPSLASHVLHKRVVEAPLAAPAPAAGITWKTYYYVSGRPVVMRVIAPGVSNGGDRFFILTDHLSSTSVVLDANGGEVGRRRYLPFGQEKSATGQTPTGQTYTFQRSVPSQGGLMHYGGRMYDPVIGRFTQPDFVVLDSDVSQAFNRYSYALNNPIRYNDPSGHANNEPACAMSVNSSCPGGYITDPTDTGEPAPVVVSPGTTEPTDPGLLPGPGPSGPVIVPLDPGLIIGASNAGSPIAPPPTTYPPNPQALVGFEEDTVWAEGWIFIPPMGLQTTSYRLVNRVRVAHRNAALVVAQNMITSDGWRLDIRSGALTIPMFRVSGDFAGRHVVFAMNGVATMSGFTPRTGSSASFLVGTPLGGDNFMYNGLSLSVVTSTHLEVGATAIAVGVGILYFARTGNPDPILRAVGAR